MALIKCGGGNGYLKSFISIWGASGSTYLFAGYEDLQTIAQFSASRDVAFGDITFHVNYVNNNTTIEVTSTVAFDVYDWTTNTLVATVPANTRTTILSATNIVGSQLSYYLKK